jgi:hypothetical protein
MRSCDAEVAEWLAGRRANEIASWIDPERVTAYEHPYGFTVVRLPQKFIDGWQIRVHLWPSKSQQQLRLARNGTREQQVHAHGWNLWSVVLIGALDESCYSVLADDDSPLAAFSVTSDYAMGSSRLRLEQPHVSVTETAKLRRTAGRDPYRIPAGQLHASLVVEDSWSLSLVATETLNNATSTVIAPISLGSTIVNERGAARDLPHLWRTLGLSA